jgi:hypothetical protein
MYQVCRWAGVALFASHNQEAGALVANKSGARLSHPVDQNVEPVYTEESFFGASSRARLHPAGSMLTGGNYSFWFHFDVDGTGREWWSSEVILANLACALRAKLLAELETKNQRPQELQKFRAWAGHTRALARYQTIGLTDELTAIMTEAVDRALADLSWPARRFAHPPTDVRRLLQLYTSAYAWCFNEFLDSINVWANTPSAFSCSYEFYEWPALTVNATGQRQALDRAAAFRWMLEAPIALDQSDDIAFIEADVWKMRIRRLNQRVLPGQREALMSDLLDTLRVKPVDHFL